MRKIILPLADDWRETGIDGYLANSAAQIQGRFGRVLRPFCMLAYIVLGSLGSTRE